MARKITRTQAGKNAKRRKGPQMKKAAHRNQIKQSLDHRRAMKAKGTANAARKKYVSKWDAFTVHTETPQRAATQPPVEHFVRQLGEFKKALAANPQLDTAPVRAIRLAFYDCVWTDGEATRFRDALGAINGLIPAAEKC